MPRINKFKFVNFKYGESRLLSDKIIELLGDHVQIEATNTAGKSMCIQTLIQAICPLSDVSRKFVDTYNLKEPIYVTIEWILDDDKTLLITGIGFEKRSNIDTSEYVIDKKNSMYKFFTFTIEENSFFNLNIENLEFYNKDKNGNRTLKTLSEMENYLKELKVKDNINIFGQSYSSQNKYKEKLSQAGIYVDEWRDIIINLNKGESVLTNYFSKYNTTDKFIKNQLIPLIDSNLESNSEVQGKKFGINELRYQAKNFIEYCIEKDESIKSYNDFEELLLKVDRLNTIISNIKSQNEEKQTIFNELYSTNHYCINREEELKKEIDDIKNKINTLNNELLKIDYEEESFKYNQEVIEAERIKLEMGKLDENINILEKDKSHLEEMENILEYKNNYDKLQKEKIYLIQKESKKEKLTMDYEEISKNLNNIGYTLNILLQNRIKDLNENLLNIDLNYEENDKKIHKSKEDNKNLLKKKNNILIDIEKMKNELESYNNSLDDIIDKYDCIKENITTTLMGREINFDNIIDSVNKNIIFDGNSIENNDKKLETIDLKVNEIKDDILNKNKDISNNNNNINLKEDEIYKLEALKNEINKTINLFELDICETDLTEKIIKELSNKENEINSEKNNINTKIIDKKRELDLLIQSKNISMDEGLLSLLTKLEIDYTFGFDYLINLKRTPKELKEIITNFPILPYSVIISEKDYETISKTNIEFYTSYTTPILIKSDSMEELSITKNRYIVHGDKFNLISSFDINLLDEEKRKEKIEAFETLIKKLKNEVIFKENQIKSINNILSKIDNLNYDFNYLENLKNDIKNLSETNEHLNEFILEEKNKIKDLKEQKNILEKENKNIQNKIQDNKILLMELERIKKSYVKTLNHVDTMNKNKKYISEIESQINNNNDIIDKLETNRIQFEKEKLELQQYIKNDENNLKKYSEYNLGEIKTGSIEELIEKFNEFTIGSSVANDMKELDNDIRSIRERVENLEQNLKSILNKISIADPMNYTIIKNKDELLKDIENIDNEIQTLEKEKNDNNDHYNRKIGSLDNIRKNIMDKHNKEPLENTLIINKDFKNRKTIIKNEIKNIKETENKYINLKNKIQVAINTLKQYKGTIVDVIIDENSLNNYIENKISTLTQIDKTLRDLIKEKDDEIQSLNLFNINKNNMYDNIILPLTINNEPNFLMNNIEKVKLYLNEQISKLKNYKEELNKEKQIISHQIKDYLKDCLIELRKINKLGTVSGFSETLFSIQIPKDEEINYSNIDSLIEDMSEEKKLSDIDNINTYYLINKLINISNIKIKVQQYELLDKKNMILWDKIEKMATGGQKFCISFIVLSILMEYKRDNSKHFIRKTTGKVLIMDNPFGETSEEEFLKDTFKLAEKLKVQIISYTHINNSSIRDRFNKIYRMTVERTTSNKEFVDIKEDKNISNTEFVKMTQYNIGEKIIQSNIFDIIK